MYNAEEFCYKDLLNIKTIAGTLIKAFTEIEVEPEAISFIEEEKID